MSRALLARAAAAVCVAAVAVRLLDLAAARRLALLAAGGGGPSIPPESVGRAVESVSRRIPGATCLVRAVAAEALLRGRSLPASLRIGVARGREGFRAHAWAECAGRAVTGGDDPARYAPLTIP